MKSIKRAIQNFLLKVVKWIIERLMAGFIDLDEYYDDGTIDVLANAHSQIVEQLEMNKKAKK